MVQANAALNRGIYYEEDEEIYVCQYFDSELQTKMGEDDITIIQTQDNMSGSMMKSSNTAGSQEVNEITALHENMPQYRKYDFVVQVSEVKTFTINYRIPEWIMSEAIIYVNDMVHGKTSNTHDFYKIKREWKDGDTISILLPIGIRFIPLPDDDEIGAFRFGPEVLAGICDTERLLYVDSDDITSEIVMENEREWGKWRFFFKTVNQNPVIQLRRIRDIGYEPFQIYFKIKKTCKNEQ
jgi:DUF1680 family protein